MLLATAEVAGCALFFAVAVQLAAVLPKRCITTRIIDDHASSAVAASGHCSCAFFILLLP